MKLWEKLIEWSIGQDASLPSDPSLWTDANISTFGVLVKPYLQYIEFRSIDPDVFFQRIRPFREILDDNFYIQILEYHSFSKIKQFMFTSIEIDSIIISPHHARLISGWIYGVNNVCKKNNHEFRLLCRGSRDGFTPRVFHKLCDGKGPTVTVLKVQKTGEILGGYNPLSWKSASPHRYYKSRESFLFSLNSEDINDVTVSKVVDENHATYHDSSFGPCFGAGDSDFQMFRKFNVDERCRCIRTSYEKRIRQSEDYFSVDDYEIFQVLSKE
ncbi:15413_t:CDS:1 [Acaulospora colombiana]|uniref:15413_t:CDS:1 n=1 Tax=Acaulospora colombiana TaxID=27376 RepID=A0ACA9K1W7_9GLOM|nr:15413_t:CDS:1 [Acaulospora colombiana]